MKLSLPEKNDILKRRRFFYTPFRVWIIRYYQWPEGRSQHEWKEEFRCFRE